MLRDQLLKAGRTNLTPQLIKVFVTGRVNTPGDVFIPQGSSLNQAIAVAGGTKFLKGKVEFIRFNSEGNVDRRIFSYRPNASADSPNNPILASSDLIRVRESLLSGSFNVFNEITSPFIGIYSVFSLFDGLSKMTDAFLPNQQTSNQHLISNDEIDLSQVFSTILRNKFLIIKSPWQRWYFQLSTPTHENLYGRVIFRLYLRIQKQKWSKLSTKFHNCKSS